MKPELLFLILFLLGFVLYCFLGNNQGFYRKIEGMSNVDSTTSSSSSPSPRSRSYQSYKNYYGNSPYHHSRSYENYNHYYGTSVATKYYGPNGQLVVINSPSSITVINASGKSVEYNSPTSSTSTNIEAVKFIGPNGESAAFISGSGGEKAIKITYSNGSSVIYGENPTVDAVNPTEYYGSTGNPIPNNSAYAYVSPNYTNDQYDNQQNQYDQYNQQNQYDQYNQQNQYDQYNEQNQYDQYNEQNQQNQQQPYNYSSSLPTGIPKSQILPGQEDLYILKTQVVPPVCPACNPVVVYKDKECQACPACARCPEPSFECKKVPNYNAVNNEYLPTPVLTSFASFGM